MLNRIKSLPKDVRFDELKQILEVYGYHGRRPGSGISHWTFRKQGKAPITIPMDEPIKLAYVKAVKSIIESEESDV